MVSIFYKGIYGKVLWQNKYLLFFFLETKSMNINEYIFANNIDKSTKIEEIFKVFDKYQKIQKIYFLKYNFMQKEICFNSAFICFNSDKCANKIIQSNLQHLEINGKLISILPASYYRETNPTAILLGDSSHISKDVIYEKFKKYAPIEIGSVYADDTRYYTILFSSKNQRDAAISEHSNFLLMGYYYSLQLYGVFPPQSYPKACGLNKVLRKEASDKHGLLTLIHNNKKYYVNPIISSVISNKIKKEIQKNPKIKKINIFPNEGNFKLIYNVLWGKAVDMDDAEYDPYYLYLIAAYLEIQPLLEFLEDDYYHQLTVDKALTGIEFANKFGCGTTPNIRFIASHINLFIESKRFKALSPEILHQVFHSDYFMGDDAIINKMSQLVSKNITKPSEDHMHEKPLNNLSFEEYISYISDYTVDLNSIRYKFIELLESGARDDSHLIKKEDLTQ